MEDKKIDAAFTVEINLDGTLTTTVHPVDENTRRQATTYDIYGCSKELASDIESQLLADRVAKALMPIFQPKDDAAELKAKLLSALSDRGIETPQP
jgi:hypothetical protein